MPRRLLVVALLAPSLCSAQVTGTFSLDKTTFAPGEPVFLYLTLHNSGNETQEISAADPYSFCSGYKIHVTRDAAPQQACSRTFVGDCMSGALTLAPGASRTERILLNYRNDGPGDLNDPVSIHGDYTVEASREIGFVPIGSSSSVFSSPYRTSTHDIFHLRVDDALELSPAAYAPYVQQLDSKDSDVRREAARTLATIAPPALEPLLLTFATSKDYALKQFAPLALSNLSTKTSIATLAQMLVDDEPGSYESMTAAEDLSKTHDPAWFPLLLEASDQHVSMYLRYAAESGGDAAIAPLLTRLHAPASRSSAIYALGYTGSRAAVPILISLLSTQPNPDEETRNTTLTASGALRQLTHLYAEQGPSGSAIPTWHNRWQNWWLANSQTAAIYKPEDCVADTKLP